MSDELSFCVLGDLHLESNTVADRLLRRADADKPEFITTTGDLTSDGTLDSYDRLFRPFATNSPRLIGGAIGNHDIPADWLKLFGTDYLCVDYFDRCMLLWLNNRDERAIETNAEPYDWFQRQLAKHIRHLIIFAHTPPNIVDRWAYHAFDAASFHQKPNARGPATVFSGHIHAFDVQIVDSVKYVLNGAAGAAPYNVHPNLVDRDPGYVRVLVRGDDVVLTRVVLRNGRFEEIQV